MSDPKTIWRASGASVTGPAHRRRNLPNQDAYLLNPEEGVGSFVIGALADGHGAAPHFRSDRGSKIAVEMAVSLLGWAIEEEANLDLETLGQDIVTGWRSAVEEDFAGDPADKAEANIFTVYGSTLVAAAATSNSVSILQIGDGDVLVGYEDGTVLSPISPDEGLWGEQTYSLCLDNAATYFRSWTAHLDWDDRLPDFLLLATDGVSKSFRNDETFHRIAAEYRTRCFSDDETLDATFKALPSWLEELATKGAGDDATMILAVRTNL